ncbi:hypothetical protein V6N13_002125 [Hibiscus sabdariffa]
MKGNIQFKVAGFSTYGGNERYLNAHCHHYIILTVCVQNPPPLIGIAYKTFHSEEDILVRTMNILQWLMVIRFPDAGVHNNTSNGLWSFGFLNQTSPLGSVDA